MSYFFNYSVPLSKNETGANEWGGLRKSLKPRIRHEAIRYAFYL